jgi:DNA-directed RNA polymerase specialized sigma subunit
MSEEKNLFRQFVADMDQILHQNEKDDKRDQKQMLEDLIQLESNFKNVLLSHPSGNETYSKFMNFILNEKGNILSARVYFRERQDTFSSKLFKAFHKKNPEMLHRFRINFLFAKWCLEFKPSVKIDSKGNSKTIKEYKNYNGPLKKRLNHIYDNMINIRNKLCQNNLPLAINRAKIFWSKVPPSHLEYMDLIQAATEGLITALDKYVPPYRTVFRSTAIGRMTLNMMTDYNDTLVKIPPKEKRILYRANNAKRKENLTDQSKIVDYVNESFDGVTESELSKIEAAASQITDLYEKTDNSFSLAEKLFHTEESVETKAQNNQIFLIMKIGLSKLSIIEKKVILLKYGDL